HPPVAIVNAALASKLFPRGNAIGRRLRMARDPAQRVLEIVGIVGDAPIGNIREPHTPVLFRPMGQETVTQPNAHVRASGDIGAVREAYARTVASRGRHY